MLLLLLLGTKIKMFPVEHQSRRKRLAQKRGTGYLYIVSNEAFPGALKVGYARNPQRRLSQMTVCAPTPYRLEFCIQVPERVRDVEMFAHGFLNDHWLCGEWYRVDVATAKAAVERACQPQAASEIAALFER